MAVVYGQIVVADQAIMETKRRGTPRHHPFPESLWGCPCCQPRCRQEEVGRGDEAAEHGNDILCVGQNKAHWVQKVTDHLAFDVNVQ